MTSLSHLLAEPRHPGAVVARRWDPVSRVGRVVRWGELSSHVAGLRARIERQPDGPFVLLSEDAYAFAVGLLALWHSGRHAVLPPNRQPGALRGLQTRTVGVLSDRPDWFPEGSCLDPLEHPGPPGPDPPAPLSLDAVAVELFTSGTTGAEKPVAKRVRHLADEVQELDALWNGRVADATVFATASHQHLYGLLFGVLWPLCAGRPFQAEHLLHGGELVPRMREAGAFVLASVPTHLKRLARHSDVSELRGHCRGVFSSGGPLATDTASAVAGVLGAAPVEVLGSTETGGVAWRTQEPGADESFWTPFPSVRITRDGQTGAARVDSPFVSVDEGGGGFATGDRIEVQADGRFRLAGRADRVVKIGEKRLDLAQMESRLRAQDEVSEVALASVDRDAEPRVVAAVVPTRKGWERIHREGRRAFGLGLGASLAADWDPVLHPRLWRAVTELPENAQGKVTAEALRELFRDPEPPAPRVDRPEILAERRDGDSLERSCRVPTDLACFAGHFPDIPLVPGVLQLDWAMELASVLLEAPPAVAEIELLKLRSPLRPGAGFRIRARVVAGDRLEFRIWGDTCEHASGRVRLGEPGQAP